MDNSTNMFIRPVTIIRPDGSKEDVSLAEKKQSSSAREKVMTAYFVIGIVAVSLSAIFTYLQLKKMG